MTRDTIPFNRGWNVLGALLCLVGPAHPAGAADNQPELVLQSGHVDRVTAVRVSPDGRLIASGAWDGLIKVWDAATGEVVRTIRSHKFLLPVAFTPDGKSIAAGGFDHNLRLWDVRSGKLVRSYSGHQDEILSVAVSPDGKTIASGDLKGDLRLWNTATGAARGVFSYPGELIEAVAFSPDGKLLAAGGVKFIRFYTTSPLKLVRTVAAHEKIVTTIQFTRDGRFLVSGSHDRTAKLWNVATGEPVRAFTGSAEDIDAVAISNDGLTLATGGGMQTIAAELRLWDLRTGTLKRELKGHGAMVTGLAFLPDDSLVSCSWDQTLKLWNATTGQQRQTFYGQGGWMKAVAWSPDGSLIASASVDKSVRLWEAASGMLRYTLAGHTDMVNSVAFSSDGLTLASGGDDGEVKLWDVAAGTLKHTLKGRGTSINQVAFSPDGAVVASAGWDDAVRRWETASGKPLPPLVGNSSFMNRITYSPDGKWVAGGGGNQKVFLWDAATGELDKTLSGFKQEISSVAFSPDSRRLATGNADKTLVIWDITAGATRELSRDQDWNLAMAWSPDGKVLASGGNQQEIKLWDVAGGTVLRQLTAEFDWIWSVAFSPDGKRLVTAPADNTLRVFDVETGRLLATLMPIPAAARDVTARAIEIGAKDVAPPSNEWFTVTPEGYFDCSANAALYIRWRVDDNLVPAERYLRRFRRPDLVQQSLRREPLTAANFTAGDVPPEAYFVGLKYAATDRTALEIKVETRSRRTVRTEDLILLVNGRPLPPEAQQPIDIEIGAKPSNAVGLATGGKPIELGARAIEIGAKAVGPDTKSATATSAPAGTRVQRFTYRVPLPVGASRVRLRMMAFDDSGLGSDWVEMNPLLRPDARPVRGNLYALCIGISRYRNADDKIVKDLKFAAGDARDMAARLRREGTPLYDKVEIFQDIALTDDQATMTKVRAGLTWLQRKARPGQIDTVVVFLSGHGISDRQGRYFFPAHEFDLKNIAGTSLSGEELRHALGSRLRARSVFLFVDSCHSGALAGRGSDLKFEMTSSGVLMMASSGSSQLSYEYEGWQHGAFTLALLRSLARPDLAQDGVIYFDRLTFAVPDEISKLLRAVDQNPSAQEPVVPFQSRTLNAPVAQPAAITH